MKKQIGVCGVDAGLIMVGDPCYFWPYRGGHVQASVESIPTWEDVCTKLDGGPGKEDGHQLNFKAGHAGLGVITETTGGDGVYPVYLEESKGRRRVIVELD